VALVGEATKAYGLFEAILLLQGGKHLTPLGLSVCVYNDMDVGETESLGKFVFEWV
jgi:hypothetical protein